MNIYDIIKQHIIGLLSGYLPDDHAFVVEPCKNPQHGELAINLAMTLTKIKQQPPQIIAQEIINKLKQDDKYFLKIEVAKPAFINITLKPEIWQQVATAIIEPSFGSNQIIAPKNINIEYVSANPTGPMHVGHVRNAVLGDILANILSYAGHNITREYYINDAGVQIDVLAKSLYYRYKQLVAPKQAQWQTMPSDCYPGEYLVDVAKKLVAEHGNDLDIDKDIDAIKDFAVIAMMQMIKSDLADLGVKHDVFVSERVIRPQIQSLLTKLATHIYVGVLPPPKGKTIQLAEQQEQTIFRSTTFGDDSDRVVIKHDGEYTYFAADIAYHDHKISRGFDILINVLGADHGGYLARVNAAVQALSQGKVHSHGLLCQLVKLVKAGKPLKMSKRAGTFVTSADLVAEIGSDALRFMMMTKKHDVTFNFDIDLLKQANKDNPLFYIQYAHARCHSVLRHGRKLGIIDDETILKLDYAKLATEEQAIIKLLAEFPRQIMMICNHYEPHRIANYVYDVSAAFHNLWAQGNQNKQLRFIDDKNKDHTLLKLAFINAIANVLHNCLILMGIQPVKEML
jgi:arginyl-tRNA synthetase